MHEVLGTCKGTVVNPKSTLQRQSEAVHRGDVGGVGAVLGWPDKGCLAADDCGRGCAQYPYSAQHYAWPPADGDPQHRRLETCRC